MSPRIPRKLMGACGIATLLIFPMILTAIQLSPWFSWFEDALSDLGVSGTTATIFNSSLIIGGLWAFVFSLGVRSIIPDRLGYVGDLLFKLAALSLMGVGLFPETTGQIHFYFSVAFFLLLGLSLLANAISLLLASSKKLGWFTILLAVVSGVVWLFPHRGMLFQNLFGQGQGLVSFALMFP